MAERVVRNVDSDYLTCSICLGRFTDPRLLPCGHTFCCGCLAGHINQNVNGRNNTGFKRPQDRVTVRPPDSTLAPANWAESFPKDNFLTILLKAVVAHETQSSKAQDINCEYHVDKIKEFFCITCLQLVCGMCVVTTHKQNECNCITLEEAIAELHQRIESIEELLKEQIKNAKTLLNGESSRVKRLETSKKAETKKLDELETKLKRFYTKASTEIKSMRKTLQDYGKKEVEENRQSSQAILDQIESSLAYFLGHRERGDMHEILAVISPFESQVYTFFEALRSLESRQPKFEACFLVNPAIYRALKVLDDLGSVSMQRQVHAERTNDSLLINQYVPLPPIARPATWRDSNAR